MSSRIYDLEPETRQRCVEFLEACARLAIAVKVTHTLRTMEEQAHLYAKGRTMPGPIVTRAKPGQSPHNYGMAFDIAAQGPVPYPKADAWWLKLGEVGESVGLAWGGRWTSIVDKPHFEFPTWKQRRT